MAKKKLLEVKDPDTRADNYSSPYGSARPSFALVSSPKQGRVQLMSPVSCRDFISDAIRDFFRIEILKVQEPGGNHYRYKKDGPTIDINKLRLLITGEKDRKEKIFSGKRALELYEELAGWSKRSKITTVRHPISRHNDGKAAWLLTGPKEWMSATHMVSVVTLIMRIAYGYGPLKTENLDVLEKQFEGIAKRKDMGDAGYLNPCWDKFRTIVTRYKEIFNEPPENLYPAGMSIHSTGGVVSLCRLNTKLGGVDERFRRILEEEGKL